MLKLKFDEFLSREFSQMGMHLECFQKHEEAAQPHKARGKAKFPEASVLIVSNGPEIIELNDDEK